jgi:hypothetical protein
MPRVGFEPTIPAFERAQTVHATERAVTMMAKSNVQKVSICNYIQSSRSFGSQLIFQAR